MIELFVAVTGGVTLGLTLFQYIVIPIANFITEVRVYNQDKETEKVSR